MIQASEIPTDPVCETPEPALLTQKEIGVRLGISKSRVYQIEKVAIAKLKRSIIREAAREGVSVRKWLFG